MEMVDEGSQPSKRALARVVPGSRLVPTSTITFPSPLKEICPDCPGWPKANEYIIRDSPREKKSRDEPRFLYSNVPRE